jgi:release factor glutamine methyltransferase
MSAEARTVGEMLRCGAEQLAGAGIAEPRREARLLLALAMNVDPGVVLGYPERLVDRTTEERLVALFERRAAREPFSRIAGRREFWSLDLAISAETLDPRADSETVVETALELLGDRGAALRILDLGTGSGALLLALLSELPQATGLGVDLLPGAALTARRNAASLGLGGRALFLAGSWGQAISPGWADVILSNPPYITSSEIDGLAPEVAGFEPRTALDGGPDGLRAYRELMKEMPPLLAPDGIAVLEVGIGQADRVTELLAKAGLVLKGVRRDLAGIERCIAAASAPMGPIEQVRYPKKNVGIRGVPV